MEIKIITLL